MLLIRSNSIFQPYVAQSKVRANIIEKFQNIYQVDLHFT